MKIEFTVQEKENGLPLSDYLTQIYIPRKTKHFLRTQKKVSLNNQIEPFHTIVHSGDRITLDIDESLYPEHRVLKGNASLVDCLYEDEHLIIVNKPVHIKTHPNQPNEQDTMLNHVAAYLDSHPYVVHRLDKETSGCLLFAKNPVILPFLTRMVEQKEIYRIYEAIATGIISKNQLTIDAPIGRDRHDKRKRCINYHNGKKAITHLKVLNKYRNETRIQCQLDTGRTHQIRVHLNSIGHPLKGDPLYGTANKRLYLHASQLHLIHPITKKIIDVHAKTPF